MVRFLCVCSACDVDKESVGKLRSYVAHSFIFQANTVESAGSRNQAAKSQKASLIGFEKRPVTTDYVFAWRTFSSYSFTEQNFASSVCQWTGCGRSGVRGRRAA